MRLILITIFLSITLSCGSLLAEELPESVVRYENKLTLKLDNGSSVERVNSPRPFEGYYEAEGKPNRIYTFFGDLNKYYVLRVAYWEGLDYEFINKRTGQTFIVPGTPYFSSDERFFFLQTPDAYTDEVFQFQIWEMESDNIHKVWSMGTSFLRSDLMGQWKTDESIRLHKATWSSQGWKFGEMIGKIELKEKVWHLEFDYAFTLKREIPVQE